MKIDHPVPEQYQQLVQLWKEAFGDTEEFIDGFFCTAFSPARCRLGSLRNICRGIIPRTFDFGECLGKIFDQC